MAATRRSADESRTMLIEAAVRIINEDGYAALTARNLAERVGLKRQIVHYYFRTMEDLLLAVVHHYGDAGLARLEQALASSDPLRAIWETEADPSATTPAFMAMAKHIPAISAEIALYFRKFRELQIAAVQRACPGLLSRGLSAEAAIIIVQSIAQGLIAEKALGAESSHAEVSAWVERWIDALYPVHLDQGQGLMPLREAARPPQ